MIIKDYLKKNSSIIDTKGSDRIIKKIKKKVF